MPTIEHKEYGNDALGALMRENKRLREALQRIADPAERHSTRAQIIAKEALRRAQ